MTTDIEEREAERPLPRVFDNIAFCLFFVMLMLCKLFLFFLHVKVSIVVKSVVIQ